MGMDTRNLKIVGQVDQLTLVDQRYIAEIVGLIAGGGVGLAIHRDLKTLMVNQALADIVGYSVDELMQMNGIDIIHPDWRQSVRDGMQEERAHCLVIIRKDGQEVMVEVIPRSIVYDGEPARMVVVYMVPDEPP